jgi:hypothetical protein
MKKNLRYVVSRARRRVLLDHVFRRAGAKTQAAGTQADTLQIAAKGQLASICYLLATYE